MSLIKTDELLQRHLKEAPKEENKARIKAYCDFHLAQAALIDDKDLAPTNAERQLGQVMWPHEFEPRLKSLVPNLHFEHNSWNPKMKALYLIHPDGTKEYLQAYHNSPMPEYSIFNTREEEIWDGTPHISRQDLPKGEIQADGSYAYDSTAARPGFKKIKKPWNEITRGWRTVLLRLLGPGLITINQLETVFGPGNRPSWTAHTGKQKIITNW